MRASTAVLAEALPDLADAPADAPAEVQAPVYLELLYALSVSCNGQAATKTKRSSDD